jgi:hypothetical protein
MELQVSPDVLIIPSQLRHGTKTISLDPENADESATVLINPGFATRGASGGTLAWITLHPFTKDHLEEVVKQADGTNGDYVFHSAHTRMRVDIVRV